MLIPRLIPTALIAILAAAGLTSCAAPVAQSDAGSDSTVCDPNSTAGIDSLVCDDLNDEAAGGAAPATCDLASGDGVFTEGFAAVADSTAALRCSVPADADLIASYAANGLTLDNIVDLGSPGDADYNIFYLSIGACITEVTYWPATNDYTPYKGTSTQLGAHFATPAEATAARLADCAAR